MYVTASDTVNINVEFKGSTDELVVPDTGTFSYTVIRLDGTVVLAETTPTLGANDTDTTITLTAPTTNKITTNDSETIVLKYEYDVSGTTKIFREYISLVAERKYIITEDSVRNALGATNLILPDEMIDLHASYVSLKNGTDIGTVDLDNALLSGGYNAQLANNAILYLTAYECLTKLDITLIKTHTEDNITVTHFEADMMALRSKIAGRYYKAVSALNSELDSDLRTVSDLFIVSNPDPDVITGET